MIKKNIELWRIIDRDDAEHSYDYRAIFMVKKIIMIMLILWYYDEDFIMMLNIVYHVTFVNLQGVVEILAQGV